jgi:hypothetical protein
MCYVLIIADNIFNCLVPTQKYFLLDVPTTVVATAPASCAVLVTTRGTKLVILKHTMPRTEPGLLVMCFRIVSSYLHHIGPKLSCYPVHVLFHLDGKRPRLCDFSSRS